MECSSQWPLLHSLHLKRVLDLQDVLILQRILVVESDLIDLKAPLKRDSSMEGSEVADLSLTRPKATFTVVIRLILPTRVFGP